MKKIILGMMSVLSILACSKEAQKTETTVTSVDLNKTTLELIAGESETLVAIVKPSDVTDKTVTWSTSNASIATVENGKVTAVIEGEATITAQAGEKTADCKVVVLSRGAVSSGVFSVSSTQAVKFSKGNLRYAMGKWSFFENQWDYYTSYSADEWDKFGWSTSLSTYGMSISTNSDDYYGYFIDWGTTMGSGWRTLSMEEWTYLLKSRDVTNRYCKATVNGVPGLVIFPDSYTHPAGITAIDGISTGFSANTWSGDAWLAMESVGVVFLPAAGRRSGTSVYDVGSYGYYWSSTLNIIDEASRNLKFFENRVDPNFLEHWHYGFSVRLVQDE